jgi:hypothetical protein
MNETLQQDDAGPKDEFREQRRRKWNPSDEQIQAKRNSNIAITRGAKALPQIPVPVQSFFAPPRIQMETEDEVQHESANQAGSF